jgi:hypothetical protein
MTGKRVRSLHNPVHFVGYMLKKRGAIALLQPLENLANTLDVMAISFLLSCGSSATSG